MKVAIGLLFSHGFPIPTAFVKGMLDWHTALLTGEGNAELPPELAIDAVRVIHSEDFPVDAARNVIVRAFLDEDTADALVFLDADMRHPRDVVHRLVSHNLAIVSGRYQMRKPPFHTVAMKRTGDGPHDFTAVGEQSGLVPIDAGGAGVLLIRRDVLEAIRARIGDNWFNYQVGPNGIRSISEDMWFYAQAKAAGFPAFVDLDLVCSHVGSFEIDPHWHQPFREAYAALKAVPGEAVAGAAV